MVLTWYQSQDSESVSLSFSSLFQHFFDQHLSPSILPNVIHSRSNTASFGYLPLNLWAHQTYRDQSVIIFFISLYTFALLLLMISSSRTSPWVWSGRLELYRIIVLIVLLLYYIGPLYISKKKKRKKKVISNRNKCRHRVVSQVLAYLWWA